MGNMNIEKRKNFLWNNMELFVMCLPAVLLIFVYNYLPMFGIVVAFKQYRIDKGFWGSAWIGFKNFEFLFKSQDAWRITRNTLGLNFIFITVTVIVSIAFALMLNEIVKRVFIKTYQTILFFPYFLSWVVVSYALYAFLADEYGILNTFLTKLGYEGISWYSEPKYWPVIFIIAVIWKSVGYTSIIYYAGLMGVDKAYYEAAEIDGATRMQMAWKISIPLIQHLIIITVLLQIGRIFYSDFGMFYNLPRQSGMLFETTDVIDTYVFRSFRVTGQVGMASAAGLYQSVVGFILVNITNYITKKINSENALF